MSIINCSGKMDEYDDRPGNALNTKKCFRPISNVLLPTDIAYNPTNSMLLFWNKYQVFITDYQNIENIKLVLTPEFVIQQLILTNTHIVCLDDSGNIHTLSLKFKCTPNKRKRTDFQPREKNVLKCVRYGEEYIMSIKYESDSYFICLNEIAAQFKLIKKISLNYSQKYWNLTSTVPQKCLLSQFTLSSSEILQVSNTLNAQSIETKNVSSIVLLSLDKCTIFAFFFGQHITDVNLMIFYTSPVEICSMEIININYDLEILIILITGTIIKTPFVDMASEPRIVHLNSAIYKYLNIKDTIIYTDGHTLWKSDDTFSREIKFTQFFLRQTKDFVKIGDMLLCTTFSNCIYSFSLEDETIFLKQTQDDYCPLDKILNNNYICSLMDIDKKNKSLCEKLKVEENYISALALANRQDIMNVLIQTQGFIYDNCIDIIKDHEVRLTNKIKSYFGTNIFSLLLHINFNDPHQKYKDIFTQPLSDLRVHITIISGCKILNIFTVKIKELKKVKLLVPVDKRQLKFSCEMDVSVKLIMNIPGAHDAKQKLWAVLYKTFLFFGPEHFVKTNVISGNIMCLNEHREPIEDLILGIITEQHDGAFTFMNIKKQEEKKVLSLRVKLPEDYKELIRTSAYFHKNFVETKSIFFIREFTSEEFLNGKSDLSFEIGDDKIRIKICKEYDKYLFNVEAKNYRICAHIRNFLAHIIYGDYANYGPNKEFVSHGFCTALESFTADLKQLNRHPADSFNLIELVENTIFDSIPF